MKEHKWADVLRAIADGKPIQYRSNNDNRWHDKLIETGFYLSSNHEYRVKPETKKYRVYGFIGPMTGKEFLAAANNDVEAANAEKMQGFVRWLTDWVDYEVI